MRCAFAFAYGLILAHVSFLQAHSPVSLGGKEGRGQSLPVKPEQRPFGIGQRVKLHDSSKIGSNAYPLPLAGATAKK